MCCYLTGLGLRVKICLRSAVGFLCGWAFGFTVGFCFIFVFDFSLCFCCGLCFGFGLRFCLGLGFGEVGLLLGSLDDLYMGKLFIPFDILVGGSDSLEDLYIGKLFNPSDILVN